MYTNIHKKIYMKKNVQLKYAFMFLFKYILIHI